MAKVAKPRMAAAVAGEIMMMIDVLEAEAGNECAGSELMPSSLLVEVLGIYVNAICVQIDVQISGNADSRSRNANAHERLTFPAP